MKEEVPFFLAGIYTGIQLLFVGNVLNWYILKIMTSASSANSLYRYLLLFREGN